MTYIEAKLERRSNGIMKGKRYYKWYVTIPKKIIDEKKMSVGDKIIINLGEQSCHTKESWKLNQIRPKEVTI